ncbi:MAG: transketolase [Spirochaetia bacterium]|jgi:transketolase|nr:transketolase [Spirochaetia bacterium]
MELQELKRKALEIRALTIREIGHHGSGHIGGSMSIVELLTYLYYQEMRIDPKDPKKEDRDRFVCSKGHAGPAVYATLSTKGYFPEDWLMTLNHGGTRLPSHCDMTKTPGIDFTGGSLGQGFSAAVGIALGQKVKGLDARTFVVIGDGESQEGQIWEGAETAAQWKLGNLIAFTDLNKLQLDGPTDSIVSLENVDTRWLGFGWHVQRINGHDFKELKRAIDHAKEVTDRPSMIVMDTEKSHGFIPGEGITGNHSMAFDEKTAEEAINALYAREGVAR